MEGVGEEDIGAALTQGDGGGQARGASSGDEYVTVVVAHLTLRFGLAGTMGLRWRGRVCGFSVRLEGLRRKPI